jgi:hypothetical protein
MVHPFEKAKLGTAPFSCTHITENVWENGDGTTKGGGVCDYCGMGIRWEFWIKGSVKGAKQFKVGCDCVAKTGWGIEGFEEIRKAHARSRRQAGAQKRRDARNAAWAKERAERAAKQISETQSWRDENAALVERLNAYEGDNSFLRSMAQSLAQWGNLTARQKESVESCFAVIDRKEAMKANSQHIGAVGDKVIMTITVAHTVVITSMYGNTYLSICTDEHGNSVIYKGNATFPDTKETATIKATIKEHGVRDGVKQTIIQRPKIIG